MQLRALLELCRISNLPTVWSNCWLVIWTGTFLYGVSGRSCESAGFAKDSALNILAVVTLLAIAMSLIYCGGMVMNDFIDRRIDAIERPRRPIPSGRVKPAAARWLAILMLTTGLTISVTLALLARDTSGAISPGGVWFGLLIATVVGYNLLHQHVWAILLMGLCRSLIVLGCSAVMLDDHFFAERTSGLLWIGGPAATLLLYTLAISTVARREVEPGGFGGPKAVMNMIAAMPLLDAAWLAVLLMWILSGKSGDHLPLLFLIIVGFPLLCAVLTKLGHRKVAGS